MVADILKDAEQITLKNMERGKYFRIAADVFVDGENLSEVLAGRRLLIGASDTRNDFIHAKYIRRP